MDTIMRYLRLAIALLVAALGLAPLAAAPPASAQTPSCGSACQLFGGANLTFEGPAPFSPAIEGHAESSTVIWNGRPLMYYRTFVNAGTGERCPDRPQGIAVATSANGGVTWTPRDGGRPLPALRTVANPGGHRCIASGTEPSTWVYAPDVIVDGSRLVMVFEQRDYDPNWYGPGSGRALHSIRYVTSTDGFNWSTSRLLLRWGNVGAWDDEVGTPDLEKDGAGYVLTFHGHDSRNWLRQRRGLVRLSSLGNEHTGARTQITLSPVPSWAGYGVGMAHVTREADGYWYAIFEAFSGATGSCNRGDTRTAVGVARSTDLVRWSVRPDALLTGVGDGLSCGLDMPNFQMVNGVRTVVTTDDPPNTWHRLLRWRITPSAMPVGATNLLVNPGFEHGAGSWGPGNGTNGFNFAAYYNAYTAHDGAGFMASNTAVPGQSLAQLVGGSFGPGGYTATVWVRSTAATPVSGRLVLWAMGPDGVDKGEIGYSAGPGWTPLRVSAQLTSTRTTLKLELYEDTANITYFYDSAKLFRS